jgi:hypothetical protein
VSLKDTVLQQQRARGDALPPPSGPLLEYVPGNVVGQFFHTPAGVILHGTRSGQPYTVPEEYAATLRYVRAGASGLGWNVTVGSGVLALHINPAAWGWNARGASSRYLAAEFAQANLGGFVTDQQIDAFCWWVVNVARKVWPALPLVFPNHSDLAEGIQDGKTDIEVRGASTVRSRILARLRD